MFIGYVVQFQAYQPCAWTKPLGGPREAMVEWVNRRHEGNLAWTLRKNWRPHSETVASRVFAHAFGRSADTECMPSVFPWGNYGSKRTVKLKNLASMRKIAEVARILQRMKVGVWWANAQAPVRTQLIRINKIRRMRRRNKVAMRKLNHKSQGELWNTSQRWCWPYWPR